MKARVLVIEDDESIRTMMVRVLSREYDVDEVESAERAARLIHQGYSYAAIVCDHMLPGFSGTELMEAIEVTHYAQSRKILYVTAHPAAVAGKPFIAKPFAIQTLLDAVKAMVGPVAQGDDAERKVA